MTNTTDNTTENKKTPDFYIHAKTYKGVESKIGSRIGAAFYHKNEKGLNIFLDAQPIPLNGQIELVAFAPDEKS